jgi:transposase-like protein
VRTDQELLEMFSKYVDSKVVHMTITYTDGCRPYFAIDTTFLTGRFRGQLACAVAVDRHNWMYPVAVGVFDSETSENWKWFLERLRDAIGLTHGLAICTDAGQAVMAGVKDVFPTTEHRECMLHLVKNFKNNILERFLKTTFGQQHILGAHTSLRCIGELWRKHIQQP